MSESPLQEVIQTGLEAIKSYPGGDLDGVYVRSDDSPFELPLYQSTRIVAAEGKSKFIKAAVRCVRQSKEYKMYLGHLRQDHKMDTCSFQPGIVLDEDVELEFHHCPLTLYDVCHVVFDHLIEKGGRCTTLSLADEVVNEHFEERIGLVPLTRTNHALVHNGMLRIHPLQVYGRWLEFIRRYSSGVSDGIMEKLVEHLRTSNEDVAKVAKGISYKIGHFRTNETPEKMLVKLDNILKEK